MASKLYVKLGTMSAGKSLELLKTADTYERNGRRVLVLIPEGAGRDGDTVVSSRIGLSHRAYPISKFDDLIYMVEMHSPDVVLIDEAQFLTAGMVKEIALGVVDGLGVPVIAFGLKTNFKGELFEGTSALLALADDISEIKGLCVACDRKATMNLRFVDGKPVYDGEEVQIGDEEYKSVCRKHYYKWEEYTW
ncbi:thymidine kinase [Bacillus thuringiensis serovar silo]|uniref:thymidine kinase n=1 Tax=Bacillus thuringiensis TaxID=1428 RepID=UPI000A3BDA81|nr:thymidine kinase [Bacillus thuringiensis]MDA2128699.1 thymidine kinase [Bacillus cereus]MED3275357.1 thymidine kinase [Bacillus thuringiensis]OTW55266.1 thymidine kinase [Bacillus thuringiensis serovar silo]OTW74302.1 thymidine kinase [Bacillus thuringiensis serovar toguchini]